MAITRWRHAGFGASRSQAQHDVHLDQVGVENVSMMDFAIGDRPFRHLKPGRPVKRQR
jgi:hypothetical protein